MTNLVLVLEDDSEIHYENVLGHQVGYGAAQVMLENGSQEVHNNFKSLIVLLTAEEEAQFVANQKAAQARAEANAAAEMEALKKEVEAQEELEEPPLAN